VSVRVFAAWLAMASLGLMPLAGSASTQVEALLQQAEAVRSSDSIAFQKLMLQLNAAKQKATPQQREQLRYLNAYAQAYAGNYDVAAEQARQLLEASDDVDIQFRAGALMVNSYASTRKFTEGLRQLERTLELLDKVDPKLREHGLFVAAYLYREIGQYQLALHYADRILSQPAPGRTQCFSGWIKLEALQKLDSLPADDAAIIRVVDQCKAVDEAVLANTVRGLLARKWQAQGQLDRAIALLQDHLPEIEATRFPRLIGAINSQLAEYLLAKGDVAGAEAHAQAAIEKKASLANSPPLVMAYKTMHDIAEGRQDPVAALSYYRSYAEADRAYLNDVKARELAYEIVRQETQQKNQQIELLNRQNQVLQLRQRVDKQAAQNTRLLVVLLVILLAVIGYWAYRIKRRQLSLRHLAETDALTGICNRHHFTLQSTQTLARCAQIGDQAALVMFDLDHFKAINDSYGHITGDWVLERVADTCKALCRRVDHIGRLGGEEFAILIHGYDSAGATRLAEDCRVRIASIDTRESGHVFTVTASFGVSGTPLSGYDLAKLLSHADQMLYRAKREGRNRVRAFTGDAQLSPQPTVTSGALGSLGS